MKKLMLIFLASFSMYSSAQDTANILNTFLSAGQLEQASTQLSSLLEQNPGDDTVLFSMGIVHFLSSLERLVQDFHYYGLRSDEAQQFGIPILRLPTPVNTNPQTISYQQFREVLSRFNENLAIAGDVFEQIQGDARLPIRMGQVRLDLDGDGIAIEDERFWYIFTQYNQQAAFLEQEGQLDSTAKDFEIVFDRGDVHWFLGYTHLLMAMCEFYLAHDGQALFESTAHLFYPKVESPHSFLQDSSSLDFQGIDFAFITDVISLIHLIRLDIAEPQRMQVALEHLEEVITQSRLSWDAIRAETDNDREWLPNARQNSVVPAQVSEEMIEGWLIFLSEAEAILKGHKLIPYWRVQDGRGINFRRIFTEPATFDLVLWLQGSAATPYLENGELTQGETWQRLQNIFGGNFIGFAIWFN